MALTPTKGPPQRRLGAWFQSQGPATSYLLALVIVALTFVVRSLIAPTLGTQSLYLFLMPALLIAGAIGYGIAYMIHGRK